MSKPDSRPDAGPMAPVIPQGGADVAETDV